MQRRVSNRRASRVELEARAHGRAFRAQLFDLSATGCSFDCSDWSRAQLGNGDRISFKLADGIKVTGKIAWRQRGTAGVRFVSTLPESFAMPVASEATLD